jgi:hypothetical protein
VGSTFVLDPTVSKVKVGLSWDAGCDLDASATLIGKDFKVLETHFLDDLVDAEGAVTRWWECAKSMPPPL